MIADALVSASIGGSLTIFGGLRFAVDNGTVTCSAATVGSELAANSGVASLADRWWEMQMCRHLWVRASGGVVGVGECANPATAN